MIRLNWGMMGGGEGSQIGPAHRLGALADGNFTLAAGALDADPARGKDYAQRLGVSPDRAYGDWREMLEGERHRADRVELVTVATPNSTHFEITKAFLEAGFHVLCKKPMTMTVETGEAGLSDEAARLSRVAIAHPEGFPLAVANIYVDLAAAIRGEPRDGLPTAEHGLRSMAAVYACVESARANGAWLDARPPMLR